MHVGPVASGLNPISSCRCSQDKPTHLAPTQPSTSSRSPSNSISSPTSAPASDAPATAALVNLTTSVQPLGFAWLYLLFGTLYLVSLQASSFPPLRCPLGGFLSSPARTPPWGPLYSLLPPPEPSWLVYSFTPQWRVSPFTLTCQLFDSSSHSP